MKLEGALKASPVGSAYLDLSERTLLVASPFGYSELTNREDEGAPASVVGRPMSREEFDETRDFADNAEFHDMRAPQSSRWEPAGEDFEGMPDWARAVVLHVITSGF